MLEEVWKGHETRSGQLATFIIVCNLVGNSLHIGVRGLPALGRPSPAWWLQLFQIWA